MGYDIYGSNMYVGRLGSAHATCLLDDYLEKKGGKELQKFVNTGFVEKTPKLMKELAKLPLPEDRDTKFMVKHFIKLVDKCEDLIMLSDGTNIDLTFIFDINGCVGELCWQTEVPLLNKYLEKHGGDLMKELAKNGTVKKSARLMKELNLSLVPEDKDDDHILYRVERLLALAKKCKKVVIITDGFDDKIEGPQILLVP